MKNKELENAVFEILTMENLSVPSAETLEKKNLSDSDGRYSLVSDKLVTVLKPRSIESDYFRFLRSKIQQKLNSTHDTSGESADGKIILVTGPSSGSGKTVISMNLAVTLARSEGNQVLYMDADTRKSTSQDYLGLNTETLPGLSDILLLRERAGKVLLNTGIFDLVYLPSGRFSEEFLDTLRGRELNALMNNLRKRFKYIVVDSPPAFPLPEAAILAQQSDAVLVVLRAEKDGKEGLEQTLEALENTNVMGVILNGVRSTVWERYGYGPGRYGPGRYYTVK